MSTYCKSLSFTKFVNFKNRGGLVFGSKSVFLTILEAEKMFSFLTDNFCFIYLWHGLRYIYVLVRGVYLLRLD